MNTLTILLTVNCLLLFVVVVGGGYGLNFLRKISRDVTKDLKENIKIADNLYQAIITPRNAELPYQRNEEKDV